MESMNFLIKPLHSTNYVAWCSDIKVLLLERGCWDIIVEREAAPFVKEGDEIDARKLKSTATRVVLRRFLAVAISLSGRIQTTAGHTCGFSDASSFVFAL
ncbi:hypothetical protein AVEN_229982-1 [Araneus ventricosus]|uniref:DUF4219 domain-containing protein n=1 Tax=Araneus ventricosus TaxID=182803 RepID=A0A4Y2BZK7_ARAVE|nr:hypothetical protein AVEN_229982-1 [Araneus ventricosus]